jgi:hypothetical protein
LTLFATHISILIWPLLPHLSRHCLEYRLDRGFLGELARNTLIVSPTAKQKRKREKTSKTKRFRQNKMAFSPSSSISLSSIFCIMVSMVLIGSGMAATCGSSDCQGPIIEIFNGANCAGTAARYEQVFDPVSSSMICRAGAENYTSYNWNCVETGTSPALGLYSYTTSTCVGNMLPGVKMVNACLNYFFANGTTISKIYRCGDGKIGTSFAAATTSSRITAATLPVSSEICTAPHACTPGVPYVTHYDTSDCSANGTQVSKEIIPGAQAGICYFSGDDEIGNFNMMCIGGAALTITYYRGACNTAITSNLIHYNTLCYKDGATGSKKFSCTDPGPGTGGGPSTPSSNATSTTPIKILVLGFSTILGILLF